MEWLSSRSFLRIKNKLVKRILAEALCLLTVAVALPMHAYADSFTSERLAPEILATSLK